MLSVSLSPSTYSLDIIKKHDTAFVNPPSYFLSLSSIPPHIFLVYQLQLPYHSTNQPTVGSKNIAKITSPLGKLEDHFNPRITLVASCIVSAMTALRARPADLMTSGLLELQQVTASEQNLKRSKLSSIQDIKKKVLSS